MSYWERLARRASYAYKANTNDSRKRSDSSSSTFSDSKEDPEKILEDIVEELREDLVQSRQIASQPDSPQKRKKMLEARARAAKASERINQVLGSVDTSGAIGAFERMEEKVTEIEAQPEAVAELAGDTLASESASLEPSIDVDSELAMLKAQLAEPPALEGTPSAPDALSAAGTESLGSPQQQTPVDAELEELRNKLDQI